MLLIGSSNAGKSQIAESLALTCLKVPLMHQGQNNNFAFQESIDKNVILHQEALFAKGMYETYKLANEGGITEVAVKRKPNSLLYRTPYMITCNVIPWLIQQMQLPLKIDACHMICSIVIN